MEQQADYKARKQTIFRTIKNEENPFVMIDRRPIENPALSWKAKGVLTYLLSRPNNWIVRIGDLVKRSPDGVYAIRQAIKELEQAGHVYRKEIRDPENKQFLRYELEVYELPFTSKPLTNFPHAENPHAENLPLNDTDCNENELNNGADAPKPSIPENMPIEWQIAGNVETVVLPDQEKAKREDFANLVAMGTPNPSMARQIALAFQEARNMTLPESKVKAQRKAIKEMLDMGVNFRHVSEATRKLIERGMTVADMFSVVKTAVDLATQPQNYGSGSHAL